jgi:hypothetical protein
MSDLLSSKIIERETLRLLRQDCYFGRAIPTVPLSRFRKLKLNVKTRINWLTDVLRYAKENW